MIECSLLVIFVVVEREVTVLEPDNLYSSILNTRWVEPCIVHADQPLRGEFRSVDYLIEPLVGSKSVSDDVQAVKINWGT
ncbi:hypothetical protein C454_00245 [Haloferax gibbonsii ATCC 33959]|uniref:Uncharacterized protein n=1 Tax=Haloferax gibbonsii (strain ATCC 33959 / DSM 4427 / JCM 8863 / NBRC 102184 / NCIMB 2188 / Ma 2.38) TaxID=1227459 RepID=M0HT52_HALGM|nr:hypothetical protein C454_00245 [Haloferax gibbonsii ATCC 33959]